MRFCLLTLMVASAALPTPGISVTATPSGNHTTGYSIAGMIDNYPLPNWAIDHEFMWVEYRVFYLNNSNNGGYYADTQNGIPGQVASPLDAQTDAETGEVTWSSTTNTTVSGWLKDQLDACPAGHTAVLHYKVTVGFFHFADWLPVETTWLTKTNWHQN